MISDELFVVGRRRGEIGRAANQSIDQNGGAAAVSARKLAASLWRLSETTSGGGSVSWRSVSFDRLGFQCPTEAATKWDHCSSKARRDRVGYFHSSLVSTEPKRRILDSKKERHKTKRSVVKNLEDCVRREREHREITDDANSKLLGEISEAKSSAQKVMRNLVKEKKDRELLEDICKELAKEIEGYKAEICKLKSQREKVQEEVENERKMMQIAGVWREEQARMKLCDAELILENKFGEMNTMIGEVKAVLSETNKLQRGERVMNRSTISSRVDKAGSNGSRRNPHIIRAMEGHIEWPQVIKGTHGPTEEKLLEAKFKIQKTITRNVLKRQHLTF